MQDRPRFRVISGDILSDPGIPLIPVNCKPGVMGKGLAKAFADRYPGLKKHHHETVSTMGLRIGCPCIAYLIADRPLVLFPTKNDWRKPSRIDWILAGLGNLHGILARVDVMRDLLSRGEDACSFAVPALGCGEGGLDFGLVGPLISAWAAGLPGCYRVTLYRPA
jgi:hypothetical protein